MQLGEANNEGDSGAVIQPMSKLKIPTGSPPPSSPGSHFQRQFLEMPWWPWRTWFIPLDHSGYHSKQHFYFLPDWFIWASQPHLFPWCPCRLAERGGDGPNLPGGQAPRQKGPHGRSWWCLSSPGAPGVWSLRGQLREKTEGPVSCLPGMCFAVHSAG